MRREYEQTNRQTKSKSFKIFDILIIEKTKIQTKTDPLLLKLWTV
jgi:hypothetical protein